MERAKPGNQADTDIQPYSVHVSARYLELTKQKLQYTRLPRETTLPNGRAWALGTPKKSLEPLIDHWLERYNWREQEAEINLSLPQFRTIISLPRAAPSDAAASNAKESGHQSAAVRDLESGATTNEKEPDLPSLRIHFVHKRSTSPTALPLLFCHGWPGTFLEVAKIAGPLTSPIPTHLHAAEDSPSFHVIAPSFPGCGFSDALPDEGEDGGARRTADVFDALMKKLGYDRYIVHGSQWGFKVARALAVHYPESCIAIHTAAPPPAPPSSFSVNRSTFLKHQLSELVHGRLPPLSIPVPTPSITSPDSTTDKEAVSVTTLLARRPQTFAHALCDSPAGLLALVLDYINATSNLNNWSVEDILNWTMMLWLPGPEAGLRWLRATGKETQFTEWSDVPLGLSIYEATADTTPAKADTVQHGGGSAGGWSSLFARSAAPPAPHWLSWAQRVTWQRRRTGRAGMADWDAASDVILDLRQFCATGKRDGWLQVAKPSTSGADEDEGHKREACSSRGITRSRGSSVTTVVRRAVSVHEEPKKSGGFWRWPWFASWASGGS